MGMHEMIHFFRQMSGKLDSALYAGIQGQTDPRSISFMRQLQKDLKKKNSLDATLEQLEVVVFDLETTGFSPETGDRPISIGAIKMTGSQVEAEQTFYSLINSKTPIPPSISELTNIRDEDLLNAPDAKDVLLQFYKFIGSRILIAHHAIHEKSFMQKLNRDYLRIGFDHRIIDTSFLIRLSDPHFKPLSLEDICSQCGIAVSGRHHALSDAKMTAMLWSHYLKKAQELGFSTLRDVYEHLARL
ncbi:MAG: exonuclease domain-containing protein [Bacillota bacterium]|nr:exonuclease domain-containing protein [Bacillota bacterium]